MNNQKEKNKVEFNINFGGFYESNNSYMIDNAIASYFDADDVDCVKESDMDNVDYKAMQYNYGSEWLDLYNNEFNHLTLEYKGIDSPDYYNFETDQIIVSINTNDVDNLINELKNDIDFVKYVDDNSKSYDGFNSFYVGFDNVTDNKAVFMTYYTDYLTTTNKDLVWGFWQDIYVNVEFNKELHLYKV
jgi:hypothetical protein